MEKIKLYFAGAGGGGIMSPPVNSMLKEIGIKNRLVSFLYKEQFKEWILFMEKTPGNMIIDSGAFSAWNKGEVVNLNEYIKYVQECSEIARNNNQNIRIVNLDVIPGDKGKTMQLNKFIGGENEIKQNKELIEICARKGYKNLKILLSEGIKPIHVFHQGEDFKWLDRMVELTDYIGISPANDMPINSKIKWIESVFTYLYKNNIKVKTHGFAVLIFTVLRDFPWTSCDAASWKLRAGYGNIYYPDGGFKNPSFSNGGNVITVSSRQEGNISKQLLKQLENDGYSYEMLQDYKIRYVINARYFINLENWLNDYKKNHQFIPHNKFF